MDRRGIIIEKKKQQERINKKREKRYGKTSSEMQEEVLMEAKMILGLA